MNKAKKTVDETEKKVEEQFATTTETVGLAGSANFEVDKPVSTKACYASLIEQSPTHANVLKMQSYLTPESESFPSAYIHANVGDLKLTQLPGEKISARVYIQASPSGEVWYSADDAPVELEIVSIEGNKLNAKLIGGKLHNTSTGESVDANGEIKAILQ